MAIVLHRTLQGPAPALMADTLELLRVAAQREVVGEYEILHHFTPLDPVEGPSPDRRERTGRRPVPAEARSPRSAHEPRGDARGCLVEHRGNLRLRARGGALVSAGGGDDGPRGRGSRTGSLDGRPDRASSPKGASDDRAPPEPGPLGPRAGRGERRPGGGAGVGGPPPPIRAGPRAVRLGRWDRAHAGSGTPPERLAGGGPTRPAHRRRAGRDVASRAAGRVGRRPRETRSTGRGGRDPCPSGACADPVRSDTLRPGAGAQGPRRAHPGAPGRDRPRAVLLAPPRRHRPGLLGVPARARSPGRGNYDQPVGGPAYGLSQWARGELVRQTVALAIPADTPPGAYPMRLGTWLPSTGRRLRVLSSDLPQARRAVTIGTLVVSR